MVDRDRKREDLTMGDKQLLLTPTGSSGDIGLASPITIGQAM
jgi:hypothetical protein